MKYVQTTDDPNNYFVILLNYQMYLASVVWANVMLGELWWPSYAHESLTLDVPSSGMCETMPRYTLSLNKMADSCKDLKRAISSQFPLGPSVVLNATKSDRVGGVLGNRQIDGQMANYNKLLTYFCYNSVSNSRICVTL